MHVTGLNVHVLSRYLTDPKFQLFHIVDREESQIQLRETAGISDIEYKEIDLTSIYPIEVEEIFKNLPDKPGIIAFLNYDQADPYLQEIINFTVLYYEYRIMITSNKGIVPVSSKWKFAILARPNYWFPNATVYHRSYYFDFEKE
jgi:hypothetical protein